MAIELSIIVVNWNGGRLLRRCVESVVAAPPSVEYEFIVIDNASSDGSMEELLAGEQASALRARGRLRIVLNPDNKGFGRANNQAFVMTDSPLLFLLNPDTEVQPGSIDRLIATLRSDERTAACGPRLINSDGSLQVSVWRNPPAAWEMLLSGLRLYRLLPKRVRGELLLANHWGHDRRRAVGMLSGAAILVRAKVIEEVGGFDERFHVYGEDNEWCLRVVRAGWTLMFEPEAVIMHHGARSALQRWDAHEKLRVQTVAFLQFQRCCLPRRRVITNLLTSCCLLSLQLLVRRLRGRAREDVGMTLRLHAADLKRSLRGG